MQEALDRQCIRPVITLPGVAVSYSTMQLSKGTNQGLIPFLLPQKETGDVGRRATERDSNVVLASSVFHQVTIVRTEKEWKMY